MDSHKNDGCDEVHSLSIAQLLVLLSVGRQDIEDGVLASRQREVEQLVPEGAGRAWNVLLNLAKDPAHVCVLFAAVI